MTGHYTLGLYEKSMPSDLAMTDKLACAQRAGYDFLELSIDETDEKLERLNWSSGEIRAFIQAQNEVSHPVRTLCLSAHRRYPLGHPDPAVQKMSLSIMKRAVELAVNTGIRLIQLAGYDVYYEPSTDETRANFARNLEAAVGMASREGVVLAFETMETDFINTAAKAMQWVRSCDSPWLQVYPDIGNIANAMAIQGGDVIDDLEQARGHIAAAHLKETKPGVYREMEYGQGHVPFDRCLPHLISMGVNMMVAEFWYTGAPGWREKLRQNNLFLRHFLPPVQSTTP